MELYLVRHGTSTRVEKGVWGRLVDLPLAAGFEGQLSVTKSILASVPGLSVFSSPLERCFTTAEFVTPGRSCQIVGEFRAYHSGIFETWMTAEVAASNPRYLGLTYRERFVQPQHGEESIAQQTNRVAGGLLKVLRSGSDPAVVVAHYSTINIIAHLCAMNWNQNAYADGVYDIAEGGFIRVTTDAFMLDRGLSAFLDRQEL